MEDQREYVAPSEPGPSNASWWSSDFVQKFGSVSLGPREDIVSEKEEIINSDQDVLLSPQRASQILWRTGVLCEPIPDGFYSVIPVWCFSHLSLTVKRNYVSILFLMDLASCSSYIYGHESNVVHFHYFLFFYSFVLILKFLYMITVVFGIWYYWL